MTYKARVTVKEYMTARNITAYKVAQVSRGTISRNAVYALSRGEVDRVDLGTLGKLAGVLEYLTGEHVTVDALLTLDRVDDALPAPAKAAQRVQKKAALPSGLSAAQRRVVVSLQKGHRLMGAIKYYTGGKRRWNIFESLEHPALYPVAESTVLSLERLGVIERIKSAGHSWRECRLTAE